MEPAVNEETARIGLPLHLEYDLSRRQRLVPHLKLWGPMSLILPLAVLGLLVGSVSLAGQMWRHPGLLAMTAVGWLGLLCFRGFFIGLLDALLHPVRHMDIVVEEKGLGVLIKGERWWIFLDGVRQVEQLTPGVWTLLHHNGSVINIPAAMITEDQVDYIRAAGERGRTPEGIRAVIERGRLIQMTEAQEREERRKGRRQ